MRVLLVSGFLGAGKTTFIKTMARITGRDYVVLENECAQTDIDSRRLRAEVDMEVFELAEGCVCCTMKQDFAASIITIANTLDPEVLIVEPTGVARLSSLMENIERIGYDRIELLEPVVIVDGLLFERQLARADAIFIDQIGRAATIVISKTEHAAPELIAAIDTRLRAMNTDAEIVLGDYAQQGEAWFAALLERLAGAAPAAGARPLDARATQAAAGREAETLALRGISLDSPAVLIAVLDAVALGVFGEILRAKGALPCGGAWLRFDVVDGVWAITGAEEIGERSAEVVFIGYGIRRGWLREVLVAAYRKSLIGAVRGLGVRVRPGRPSPSRGVPPRRP